ncbi:hypothetical protein OB69_06380 [Roseivirga seohaensis subsp. aquiponti]|uniref:6-bladed beta-propeller n=1 Tax=Roseivirga seohaensis subsp. aquiponti TaxID=1566026 RepID=A0A0L8AMU6_9BACT|nr:hypothetical protein OB69_06380 [Roseivirga seohaensis subsp. aquiponti]
MNSCSGTNNTAESLSSSSDEFKVFTIDLKAEKSKLSTLIDEVEIMRLEEGEEGLLSTIAYFNEIEDGFVFTSGEEKGVFIYSSTGELRKKINHSGKGPAEYSDIKGLWVKEDTLFVYSFYIKKVLKYNLDGRYLGESKLVHNYGDIYPNGKSYVADLSSYGFYDSVKYKLAFLDTDFQSKSFSIPQNLPPPFPVRVSLNSFSPYKDALTYKTLTSDSVFLVEGDQARPLLKMDFGNDWLWSDPDVLENPEQASNFLQTKQKVWTLNASIGERYVFYYYGLGLNTPTWALLDRYTSKETRIDLTKTETEQFGINALQWSGDRLLVAFQSTDVANFLKELDKTQFKFREGTTLEKIESSENSVLMWVKFKEGY